MAQCSSQKEILHNLKVCKVIVYKLPIRKKARLNPIAKRTKQWKLTHESKQFEITIAQKQVQQNNNNEDNSTIICKTKANNES